MRDQWLILSLGVMIGAGCYLSLSAPVFIASALLMTWVGVERSSYSLGLMALAIPWGVLSAHLERIGGENSQDLSEYSSVIGEVKSAQLRGERLHVIVALEGDTRSGILLKLPSGSVPIMPGSVVRLKGPFTRLRPAMNPMGFDQQLAGMRAGVLWQSHGSVVTLKSPTDLSSRLWRWRYRCHQTLRDLSTYGAGVMGGLLFGDRSSVPKSAQAAFKETGTGHLLAVSGLHVAGVAWLSFTLAITTLLIIGVARSHRYAAGFATVPTAAYVYLAGYPLSAVRAGVMVSLIFVAIALGRRQTTQNYLGMAGLILLVPSPSVLLTPSFQLSFGAVWALIIWGGKENGPVSWIRVATVAFLATAPILAWHFGTLCPISPLANLVCTPIVAIFVVPLGLLCLTLTGLSTMPLTWLASAIELMVSAMETMAVWPGAEVTVGRWFTPITSIPLAVLIFKRRPYVASVSTLVLLCLSVQLKPSQDAVEFISVGQGDAVLIRSGDKAALFDTGPSDDAWHVTNYLQTQGIRELAFVAISHYHPDHFAGTERIMRDVRVRRIIDNGSRSNARGRASLRRWAERLGVRWEGVPSSDEWLGRLHLRWFPPLQAHQLSENDRSLGLRVDGSGASVLLTGDLEGPGERRLESMGPGKISALKLGHHGSRTSTSSGLLKVTRPDLTVASLGHRNRYGFPHREVLDRLDRLAVPLLRTDVNGWVSVNLESGSIRTMRGGASR